MYYSNQSTKLPTLKRQQKINTSCGEDAEERKAELNHKHILLGVEKQKQKIFISKARISKALIIFSDTKGQNLMCFS